MTYNEIGVIVLCLATLAVAAVATWLVTRPFERARREARKAAQGQAAGHAAE